MMIYDIPPPPRDRDLWEAFSQALFFAVAESITGGRFFVCAACGSATEFGCSLLCGDERIAPNKLTGLLPR